MEGLEMNPQFWKNKNVLVTGHTGFKGSWLSLWLTSLEANLVGYSLPPPTNPSLFELANIADDMTSILGDVRDLQHLTSEIEKHSPEILIHLAAQSLVVNSHENPIDTYTTNVMGTLNVLEAVRRTESVKVVLIITSDKCYKNNEWDWGYREHDTLGGIDPYSNSKACAELVTSAYRTSYFQKPVPPFKNVAVATVRAGNVVGGGDWAKNRLIPDTVKALQDSEVIIIRNPSSIRPWQHVLEPLGGYMSLAEKLWEHGVEYAEEWNFGPSDNDAKTVSWVVDQLCRLWGSDSKWKEIPQPYPHESHYLKLDCSKSKNRLEWKPKLSLDTTLEWVIEWFKNYNNKNDLRDFTKKQITKYQNL